MPPLDPRRAPLLIGSEIYRGSTYGPKHPLAIPRVSTALDLIRALGWLDPERYVDSPRATPEALARFHHPDYVAALQRAEATQSADPGDRERFGIGAHGNPVFREVFSRPATGAGGTTLAGLEEMEAAGLYTLAAKYGVRALTILTISDHLVTHEVTSAEERQLTFGGMIEVALDAALGLDKKA